MVTHTVSKEQGGEFHDLTASGGLLSTNNAFSVRMHWLQTPYNIRPRLLSRIFKRIGQSSATHDFSNKRRMIAAVDNAKRSRFPVH